MNSLRKLTFLGTGASMGIPVIGCTCSVCHSDNVHNRRSRPSVLLHLEGKTLWVDTGPDFRTQALNHHVNHLDGVIFSHSHNDHTAGFDDLRVFHMLDHRPIPCLMSKATHEDLQGRYQYIFSKIKHEHQLISKIEVHELPDERGMVNFVGLEISYFTYTQAGMAVNGYRFGEMAYVTDIKHYPETIFEDLQGVETLILSALRFTPSPLHLSLDDAVDFAKRVGAKHTWITHISHEMDHEKANAYLPPNVRLAYDGLEIII